MSIARTNSSEQTRQQILTAALRLFATHGYAGTSTQTIITASHVSKPVLYYHFGSKAGLFRVIVDEAENQLLEAIVKAKAGASDVRSQLVAMCAAMFQFARGNPSVVVLALDLSSIFGRCPFRKRYPGKTNQWHTIVGAIMDQAVNEGVLRKQCSSETLAVGFCGLVSNHIVHYLSNPQWPLDRTMAERVVSLFLDGIIGPSPHFPQRITN
jgi:AcrR family transcriptional regulator